VSRGGLLKMHHWKRRIGSKLLGMVSLTLLVAAIVLFDSGPAAAQKKAKKGLPPVAYQNKPIAPHAPKSSVLTEEAWQKAPLTSLEPGELDHLIGKELNDSKIPPAPLTTDEQFVRRVTLDLTGQLPTPADVKDFVADPASQKR